jgi:hypothetical protein
MNITIDIETIPAQRPDVMAEIREQKQADLDAALASIKVPGNYKKQETIDEWMANEKPKQEQALRDAFESSVDEAYRKTGLDGAFGQICVIGCAFNQEYPIMVFRPDWLDEVGVLQDFNCLMTDRVSQSDLFSSCVIGHNVIGFDLRFLVQRHIVHGIKPHIVITRAAQAKPWEPEKVFDTSAQWAGAGSRISLDKLCKALGIESPKKGIDGSKVWDAVRGGRIDEVVSYCARDVIATRQAFMRMTYQAA